MPVETNDPRQPYVQVADDLRRQIIDGRLAPGERIPSGRALSERYGVALMTVQNALRRLRDERLVVVTGRGAFVARGDEDDDGVDLVSVKAVLEETRDELRRLSERVSTLESVVRPVPPAS